MQSDVNAPGGVMTDEVGVVTGELTVRSEVTGDEIALTVQYKDADEWYHVTGGTATVGDAASVHELIVNLLHRPE